MARLLVEHEADDGVDGKVDKGVTGALVLEPPVAEQGLEPANLVAGPEHRPGPRRDAPLLARPDIRKGVLGTAVVGLLAVMGAAQFLEDRMEAP